MRDGVCRAQLLKSLSSAVLGHCVGKQPSLQSSSSSMVEGVVDLLRGDCNCTLTGDAVGVIETLIQKHLQKNHPVYLHLVTTLHWQD